MRTTIHSTGLSDKESRHSNIELLRIIATLFVVILHYNNTRSGKAFLYTNELPVHNQILLVFEMFSICAVNIFVMISGYFLCTSSRVKIWKIVHLYIDVVLLSVLCYLFHCALGYKTFSFSGLLLRVIPSNWYVAVYSGLYLIFPYLNQILQGKSRTQFRFMLLVFFFVLSVWPFGVDLLSTVLDFSPNSLTPISLDGSGDGYTLANFILMYFLGAYYRLYGNNTPSVKVRRIALMGYLVYTLLNMVCANYYFSCATSYCNPLVILQAVAIFVVFINTPFKNNLINVLASLSFGVYLMHSSLFPLFQIEKATTGNPLLIPFHILFTAILIFISCVAVYWGYQKTLSAVFAFIQNHMSTLTYTAQDGL